MVVQELSVTRGSSAAGNELSPSIPERSDAAVRPMYALTKRLFDVSFALLLLTAAVPLWVVTALLIRFTTPGPIIFRQTRIGRNGRPFVCYKFRTMVDNAEAQREALEHLNEMSGPVFKVRADPRVTHVGRWLRKTSADELPQLINILKGEMSVVGPRPPLPREVAQYSAYERVRLSVKPGLTCLWQVSGRSQLDFAAWVALDAKYVERCNFWYDLSIVLLTVPAVLSGRGAM